MIIDPATSHPREIYKHMVAFITPRPIAWVSTVNREGLTNLAPFSYFNGVCPNPPTILFCPTNTREGKKKDTLRNIESTGEFVGQNRIVGGFGQTPLKKLNGARLVCP